MTHLILIIIYLAFISLGLPDCMLGAAWPTMYQEFGVPVSYAGMISMIIAVCTIISSLLNDRLSLRFGTGRITAFSVATTALALYGFSTCDSMWQLCLWAIPYGFGAGCVDASLNGYAALHFSSRHMSWLHCMWGIGASTGPYVIGWVLSGGQHWSAGYRFICLLQIALTAVLFASLPLWKERRNTADAGGTLPQALTIPQILRIPGAKALLICFFCYCALEQTAMLWSATYMTLHLGMDAETAASLASMFCLGMTVGRALNGFLAIKFNDTQLIRMGLVLIAVGVIAMLLPLGTTVSLVGLILVGLGCAPIYPCIIHATPEHFGADKSQALVGVQMAFAYVGTCLMPPLFGLIANHISASLLPVYLLALLVLMTVMHEKMVRVTEPQGIPD